MTWVRYDDNVANHPKVGGLDDATYRLWREAIEWCSHNLTDGVIRAFQLPVTSTRASKARAAKLVSAELWHPAGTPCESEKCPPCGEDGWVIHDYWDYQRTAEQVRAEQEANRERQRRWMEKVRAGKRGTGVTNAGANAPPNAAANGVTAASDNGNPAPPRPAPKGGGDVPSPSGPPPEADGRPAGRREDQTTVAPGVLFQASPGATPPAELLEQTRKTLRAAQAKARRPARDPFDPNPPPDKAQQALARLDAALAEQHQTADTTAVDARRLGESEDR